MWRSKKLIVKCGSCDHVWFYKIEENKTEPLPLSDDFTDKEIEDEIELRAVSINLENRSIDFKPL